MKPKRISAGSDLGFSFVEIIAALAILAISLTALIVSQNQSMAMVAKAKKVDVAITLARMKLNELQGLIAEKGVAEIPKGEEGEFDTEKYAGYRWKYEVREVPAPDFAAMLGGGGPDESGEDGNTGLLAGPLKGIQETWAKSLREVYVEVIWTTAGRDQHTGLTTHFFSNEAAKDMEGLIQGISRGFSGDDSSGGSEE